MSSDPTLNHEAVKAYRDQFKFCPKIGFREDIISTVQDMTLWKTILSNWGYWKDGKWIKHNPLNVKGMMSEYERRAKHTNRSNAAVGNQRVSENQVSASGLPERSHRGMSNVRQGTRIQFRRSSETLEEVLTKALRSHNQS